jgi:hypothetical protein
VGIARDRNEWGGATNVGMQRKRKWRIVALAILVAAACIFHVPLLRGLAGLLIVDQPADDYNCVCIAAWGDNPNGDRCYNAAADLFHQKSSCRVLLIAPEPNRLDEIGVMPSFAAMSRRELGARGVPHEAVSVVRGERFNDWATARTLAAWLRDHPGNSVVLLCGQFHSSQLRRALDAVIEPADAASVRVRALPSRRYDDTNWWTCRPGFRAFGGSWLLKFQGWLGGGDAAQTPERSADDYERDFLHALPENTPHVGMAVVLPSLVSRNEAAVQLPSQQVESTP